MSAASSSQPTAPRLLAADRSGLLQDYFASGWAFFSPYLVLYLLYCRLGWPATAGAAATGIPALFTVYRGLHLAHVVLGLVAAHAWWKKSAGSTGIAPLLAGALLALVFFIPGVYWEFPADTWEHYLRINDWSRFADVSANSGWHKSSYFLAYSFIGPLPAARQMFWLDYYYTGMCLLLCWQYYRLARETGLGRGAAFGFVLLQALLFGNSLYSYYRYYGLASTAPAHLCALALIRLGLRTLTAFRTGRWRNGAARDLLAAGGGAILLLAFMAFNHTQALGLALLGLVAVAAWQLGEWKRPAVLWLGLIVLLASAAAARWWPVSPVLRDLYRPTGWLSPWYGFNLFAPASPAGQRSVQILGAFGLVNLTAGAWLLRRNHLAGWLTVTPVLALLCPLFAIPFATLLSQTAPDYIVVFSRMLLGIPTGLALVVLCQEMKPGLPPDGPGGLWARFFTPYPVLLGCLLSLLTIPASAPAHNRLWQALARIPADLELKPAIADFSSPELTRFKDTEAPHFVTTEGLGFAATATGFGTVTFNQRLISYPTILSPATMAQRRNDFLTGAPPRATMLFAPAAHALYSPRSFAGLLSGHWLPQEVALQHAASPESAALALQFGAARTEMSAGTYFLIGR